MLWAKSSSITDYHSLRATTRVSERVDRGNYKTVGRPIGSINLSW